LVAVATAATAGAMAHIGALAEQARTALRQGSEYLLAGRYPEALEALKAGGAFADGLPFHGELIAGLCEQRQRAELGVAARDLHDLCDRVRPLYAAHDLPDRLVRVVESYCRTVWDRRDLLVAGLDTSPDLDPQVRADLLDLAVLWADLHIRLAAPTAGRAAQEQALTILAEAEELLGPNCVVAREKQSLAAALGRMASADAAARQAAALPPRTAWEHYALGRIQLRNGDLAGAVAEMERALALQPHDVWPNYFKGACCFRAGQFEDAVTAFSVCVALVPDCAWCYFNRGLALAERGRPDAARADFDRALRLNPGLAPAALNRGVLHLKAGRPDDALADFRLALDHGAGAGGVYYQSALAHLARQDKAAARASLNRALEHDPGHQPARDLLARIGTADR
jgi:tetratricopeptide (TPR) repeat protein